uniref:Uncharacterized protein n=1 Tax=Strongyloides papillosus TaxID=174720 RepID=A0A0N5BII1_STREA
MHRFTASDTIEHVDPLLVTKYNLILVKTGKLRDKYLEETINKKNEKLAKAIEILKNKASDDVRIFELSENGLANSLYSFLYDVYVSLIPPDDRIKNGSITIMFQTFYEVFSIDINETSSYKLDVKKFQKICSSRQKRLQLNFDNLNSPEKNLLKAVVSEIKNVDSVLTFSEYAFDNSRINYLKENIKNIFNFKVQQNNLQNQNTIGIDIVENGLKRIFQFFFKMNPTYNPEISKIDPLYIALNFISQHFKLKEFIIPKKEISVNFNGIAYSGSITRDFRVMLGTYIVEKGCDLKEIIIYWRPVSSPLAILHFSTLVKCVLTMSILYCNVP